MPNLMESPSRLIYIRDGQDGVTTTLNLMAAIVKQFRKTTPIRNQAREIVKYVPGKYWFGELSAVFQWVHENIRYTQDPYDLEMLTMPRELLKVRQGDCDDHAMLVCSLLGNLGYQMRFVACGRLEGEFDHVYSQARIPDTNKFVSLDTTENFGVGWWPKGLASYRKHYIDETR